MSKTPAPATLPPAFDDLASAEKWMQTHPGAWIIRTVHNDSCRHALSDATPCHCRKLYVPTTPGDWGQATLSHLSLHAPPRVPRYGGRR